MQTAPLPAITSTNIQCTFHTVCLSCSPFKQACNAWSRGIFLSEMCECVLLSYAPEHVYFHLPIHRRIKTHTVISFLLVKLSDHNILFYNIFTPGEGYQILHLYLFMSCQLLFQIYSNLLGLMAHKKKCFIKGVKVAAYLFYFGHRLCAVKCHLSILILSCFLSMK